MIGDAPGHLAGLRQQLTAALRSGDNTAPIRDEIAEAEQAIAEQARASAQQQAKREGQRAAAAEQEITHISGTRLGALMERHRDLIPFNPNPKGTKMPIQENADHRNAVAAVTAAQRQIAAALSVANAKQAEVDVLSGRIADLERQRSAMSTRRARGDTRPNDAGEIALLDMDLASLNALHAAAHGAALDAHARTRELEEGLNAAARWLEQIERLLTVDEFLHHLAHLDTVAVKVMTALETELTLLNGPAAAGAASTLAGHASGLGARLLRTAEQIDSLSKRAGRNGPPVWGASKPLLATLRRLASARGEL